MIGIDTNLLIYAHRSRSPEHVAARRALEKARKHPEGWGVTLPSIAEFWAVVTHPTAAGRPSTAAEASRFIRDLMAAGAYLWVPGSAFQGRLIQAAIDLDVQGHRIFDLQIALAAFDNGATEIWTHDSHFVSIPGLKVWDPLVS